MEDKGKKLLLAVCTGNTCRSPMAAALLDRFLEQNGKSEAYRAESAGVAAWDGAPASENAVAAAGEQGLDLTGHRARRVTAEMLADAGRIFVMSERHRRLLAEAYPPCAEKLVVMRVADPYGGDLAAYRACLAQMDAFFSSYFEENPL